MKKTNKRLSVLSELEEFSFYGFPDFNEEQRSTYFVFEDKEWETPQFIASSLEEFIDQCLLGKRYTEFENTENNSFYDFLKSQGWA